MRLTSGLMTRMKYWSKVYSNFPDRYIDRVTEQVYWRTPRGKPQYLPRTIKRNDIYFSLDRPWTTEFQMNNKDGKFHKFVHLEPLLKWSFFRGDRVEIMTGKDKGKQGFVSYIVQERNWVLVKGLNTKLEFKGTEGSIGTFVQTEQPLLVTSQVQLVDPEDQRPTQIEWRYTPKGEEVRVSTRTGRIIPMPFSQKATVDYSSPERYVEGQKDTKKKIVLKKTFQPTLRTFEMDIMEKMGIKEDRIPAKTYWY